jgi:hypothetical protein
MVSIPAGRTEDCIHYSAFNLAFQVKNGWRQIFDKLWQYDRDIHIGWDESRIGSSTTEARR